jgi:hypothetical protein
MMRINRVRDMRPGHLVSDRLPHIVPTHGSAPAYGLPPLSLMCPFESFSMNPLLLRNATAFERPASCSLCPTIAAIVNEFWRAWRRDSSTAPIRLRSRRLCTAPTPRALRVGAIKSAAKRHCFASSARWRRTRSWTAESAIRSDSERRHEIHLQRTQRD